MTTSTAAPFGRLMTAMITPMTPDGAVDYDGAARLAAYLVDDMRNEGLVVNGTTGEAPTTTDEDKARLVKAVPEAGGDPGTGGCRRGRHPDEPAAVVGGRGRLHQRDRARRRRPHPRDARGVHRRTERGSRQAAPVHAPG